MSKVLASGNRWNSFQEKPDTLHQAWAPSPGKTVALHHSEGMCLLEFCAAMNGTLQLIPYPSLALIPMLLQAVMIALGNPGQILHPSVSCPGSPRHLPQLFTIEAELG